MLPIATPAIQISVAESSSCALLETGHVLCWGSNVSGQFGDGTRNTALYPVPERDHE
jgi:alpha-tubulin suppressor-like RCC1 family protein